MIFLPAPALDLLEVLLKALFAANALDGAHAWGWTGSGGSYEAIDNALQVTLTNALREAKVSDPDKVAARLLHEAIDNGENIAYQIDLWNKGLIDL